jgi:hypothetical protein
MIEPAFSPDETYFIVYYIDPQDLSPALPGFLYRIAAGTTIPLPDHFTELDFSPDGSYFIVNYRQAPDELRYTATEQVITFSGAVESFTISPDGAYFVIIYTDRSGEIRQASDGQIVRALDGAIWGVFPDPTGNSLVISYLNSPAELRRAGDGEIIAILADKGALVSFSANGACFLVAYYLDSNSPGELRRAVDGQLIATLDRPINVNIFHSSFTADGAYVALDYSGAPGEWRRTDDFQLIRSFPGEIGV